MSASTEKAKSAVVCRKKPKFFAHQTEQTRVNVNVNVIAADEELVEDLNIFRFLDLNFLGWAESGKWRECIENLGGQRK